MKYQVSIERMAYGADGVAHLPNGKTLFVEAVAPGDTVEVEIIEEKKGFARSKLLRIIEPSPVRVKPLSPIDAQCGTAPWQQIDYQAQLQAKRDNVTSALVHGAHVDAETAEALVEATAGSRREWNYRNKIELGVGADTQGRLALGFFKEQTHELVPVESTRMAHKAIERAPRSLRGAIRYAQGNRDLGIYRVGVRHSLATGDLEIALWTPPSAFPRATFAKTLGDACKATSIVRVLAHPGKARKIKGIEVLEGRGSWRERIGSFGFSTQAPSFFQVNTAQAERLVSLVQKGLGNVDGALVADLFAGGGTFSIPLAAAGADVIAVEAAGSSVRDLRANADRNGVEIEVVGGDARRELANLGQLDALVVDPPRAGLGPQIIASIADAHPETLAYVSCDPATWARDAALLREHGYQLKSATPVDLFPQTYHVEIASFFAPSS